MGGNPIYASINNHLGIEQSRRDDIACLGYALMRFLRGSLPWESSNADSERLRNQCILEKKQQAMYQNLCKDFPKESKSCFPTKFHLHKLH
ncbi:hypothetical protein EON65_13910 [archaeon]|nr:MAG: hypothetical protein EON65_13910 [archaeon]